MENFNENKCHRNVLHQMIEKPKHNYYNGLVLDNKNNSNKLWKIIHSLSYIKIKQHYHPKKLYNGDGNVLLNDLDISEKRNILFATVSKKMPIKLNLSV